MSLPSRSGLIRFVVVALLAVTALAPAPARAQGAAEAEQLFRDGKRLMQEKNFAEACASFETSFKLDPALTTKLNLADCREKNNQLATAWGLFVDAERETRGDAKLVALNKTAKSRSTALEARLSYLIIAVPDESRVEGLTVLRNGALLDEGLWNRAIPVDGGAIVIAGRAPGHEEWSTTVDVPIESGKISVEVPRFKELKALVDPKSGPDHPDDGLGAEDSPRALTSRRKVALGLAGTGLVALGVGVALGVQARGLRDDALALCPSNPCASFDEANAGVERARQRALFANISYGAGAALAIGAAILWLTDSPKSARARTALTPRVSSEYAGIAMSGSF